MLGLGGVPALMMWLGFMFILPESPRWLMLSGQHQRAEKVLQQIRGTENVAVELEEGMPGPAPGAAIALDVVVIDGADGTLQNLICVDVPVNRWLESKRADGDGRTPRRYPHLNPQIPRRRRGPCERRSRWRGQWGRGVLRI